MEKLNEVGLIELSHSEQQKLTGGILGVIVAGLAIAAGAEIIGDWDNFERGLSGEPYKE